MSNEDQHPLVNPQELQDALGRVLGKQEQEEEIPNPFSDPILRREAGDGWHPSGVNKTVLGAIVAREAIGKEVENAHDNEERDAIIAEFRDQAKHVAELKIRFGIYEVPPLPEE